MHNNLETQFTTNFPNTIQKKKNTSQFIIKYNEN